MNSSKVVNLNNTQQALKAVKDRFVRVPSKNKFPTFKDLVTGIEQQDTFILRDCFKINGGKDLSGDDLVNYLDVCYGDGFLPNGPAVLDGGLANLWESPKLKPTGVKVTKQDVEPFIEFLRRWFPDDEERDYFGWFLAHIVRKPEQRIIATPVLRSEHGVGKGFLCETLIANLLGRKSVAMCGLKDIVGDFNDVIEGKTFIMIDEVYKSKKSTTDHLKSIQGNSTLALHRKHKPTVTVDNYISFVITSNDHIPIMLEKGDRRFWVPKFIKHKETVRETDHFLNDVFKPWLLDGGFQLVRDYLEQVDLSKYRATSAPPVTNSKQELMGFSTVDKLEESIKDYVEENKVVTVKHIKLMFDSDYEHGLQETVVASTLMALGCKQRRTKHTRFYITPFGFESGLTLDSSAKELEEVMPVAKF
ncbi:primase-helicase family protein [Pseudomonas luteola]|uniref:primase-helicase family protein n=1 Tax=Pseudomonas luteola TaxID=47886 RepID=UPI003A881D3C